MSSSTQLDNHNYKKLAQFESAISVDLSHQPKNCENLLNLNQNFEINYSIPKTCYIEANKPNMIGTTLLDMTMNMLQDDMFQDLINRGADFTNVNGYGSTVVHNSICDNFEKQLSALKSYGSIEDNNFAEMALNAHVKLNISKNPCNSYGVSHFHIACMMNNTEAVEYFLKNKTPVDQSVNKDSPYLPGCTALHFAAKYSSYETAQLLLSYGAKIDHKDMNGMSPLCVIVKERLRAWPAVLRHKMNPEFSLDCITEYFDNNEKILKLFLGTYSTCTSSSTDDIGFSKFKAACILQDVSLVKQILTESSANLNDQVKLDSPIWRGYTALHFTAHLNSETFQFLLEEGANMGIRDAHGTSPFDMCLLSFKVSDIHSVLSRHPTWKNILFSDGKTKLLDFIYAMQDATEFNSFLDENVTNINVSIPLDSPICPGYTPLHFAVIFSEKPPNHNDSRDPELLRDEFNSFDPKNETLYGSRIKKCLDLGAHVTAQDARGWTPLHWTFRLQEIPLTNILFDHHPQFVNPVNDEGLSHLHVACATKNEFMVMRLLLLNRGDLEARVKAAYSWQSGYHMTVARSGSTPLHFARECPEIMEILLECGAVDVLAADDEGFDPLERVLGGRLARDTCLPNCEYSEEKKKVLLLLVRRLPEAIVDSTDAAEKLLCCYDLLRSNVLRRIFDSDDEVRDKILDKVGVTSLHVACIRNDVDKVRMLLQRGVDVNATVHENLPMWSCRTPLFCYLIGRELRKDDSDDFSMAKLLFESGADVMKTCDGWTAVHKVFNQLSHRQMRWRMDMPLKHFKNHMSLVKFLLSYHKNYSENPTTTSGLSHLHIACVCGNVEMVEELLKSGVDINQKIDYFCPRYGGDTPLHLAVIYKSAKIVDVLLKHGADVRSTNNYDSTPLHLAACARFGTDLKILKALLRAGADVNAVNIIGATPLELMLKHMNFTKGQVDVFLKSPSYVHAINPVTKQGCLALAMKANKKFSFVYKMFVGSSVTKKLDEMSRNAIHNVVSLKRPYVDDINNDAVDEAFPPVEDYAKAIKSLAKLNLNVDQQDRQGKTPLHYAVQMQNVTAVLGLLNNGADFNITDENGETPFAYSFHIQSTDEEYGVLDQRIMQIFLTHAIKLSLVCLDINESNNKLMGRAFGEHSIPITNKEEIYNEFADLRGEEKIKSCSVALSDFLCETGAVVTLSRLPLEERRVVDQFFKKAESLRRKYPEYAGILNLQYRKALERVKLVPLALVSVNVLMGFNVPVICSDIILQYLSNNSLKNLIDAVKEK